MSQLDKFSIISIKLVHSLFNKKNCNIIYNTIKNIGFLFWICIIIQKYNNNKIKKKNRNKEIAQTTYLRLHAKLINMNIVEMT